MFNEILLGVTDFLKSENDPFTEGEDITEITKYLSLGFDVPNYCVLGIKTITLDLPISNIVLVDIDNNTIPNDTDLGNNIRINDYAMYKGKVTKIISFNKTDAKKNEVVMVAMILGLFADIVNTIIEQYMTLLCNDTLRSTTSFTNVLKYSVYILSIAYLQKFYPFIEDESIADIYKAMNPKITTQSITSMRRLVTEFTPKSLLDDCVWYGVTNQEYPEVRFDEILPEDSEVLKWEEEDIEEENTDLV